MSRAFGFGAFLAASLFACTLSSVSRQGAVPYTLIGTDDLKAWIDRKPADLTVVDARSSEEFQEVHMRGAISVPVAKWDEYKHLLPSDRTAPLVFYCNGIKCGKSKKAAEKAAAMGYAAIWVYAEGMPVWEERGMPIYAGPDYEKRIETTIMAPTELERLIESGGDDFTVVDVRDPEEFAEGHIPGAVNIPVPVFASRSDSLDKERKIIVYCNSGGRSYNAYRKLLKLSYRKIYQAVFADWKEAGLPVAR